ncbi:5'-3' exonuclease PLD3-like isoform X2 [Oratosquilla oratoria]|uniref:5'-3' exonuclease PLD3-like isoform X2 n=1 Tax=Oratosquilla oratoria TaxID=337810 RepID=UPI003F766481
MVTSSQTVIESYGKLDVGQYELEQWDRRCLSRLRDKMNEKHESKKTCMKEWIRPSCGPITIYLALTLFIVITALLDSLSNDYEYKPCQNKCQYTLVESIPENLTYAGGSVEFPSIHSAWVKLIDEAEESLDIAAYYWTLLNDDVTPMKIKSSWQGEDVFKRLYKKGTEEKGVRIRIAQNAPSHVSPQTDSKTLMEAGAAEVRSLDFDRLMGAGVLHTKMWVVDKKHIYIGSANMDWRSLTQVKEVGVLIENCSCLAKDMQKLFDVYWMLGKEGASIPSYWPSNLSTSYNIENQMSFSFDDQNVQSYLSSSPPPFCPSGRSNDVDAIVDVINKSKKFVYIAVMDYFPRLLYSKEAKFWPVIDNALRAAAIERKVHVRLLASHWNHTRSDMKFFMKSLQDLTGSLPRLTIETRLFVVPAYNEEQAEIPFARVNHNKYMVTDNTAYIGTSNWSGDYFINTAGIGLIVNETLTYYGRTNSTASSLRAQLQSLFERDWNSEHAKPIEFFLDSLQR